MEFDPGDITPPNFLPLEPPPDVASPSDVAPPPDVAPSTDDYVLPYPDGSADDYVIPFLPIADDQDWGDYSWDSVNWDDSAVEDNFD